MAQYNFDAARAKEQLDRMIDLDRRKVCAFCPKNIKSETTSKIIIETDNWYVKNNDFPYKNTKYHFLLISKKHVKTINSLSKSARSEFLDIVALVEVKYSLTSYGVGMRSGDMRYNGGSVEHLHAQLLVGDKDSEDKDPVRFKMSSQPKN